MSEAEVRISLVDPGRGEVSKDVEMAGEEDAEIVEVQDTQAGNGEIDEVEEADKSSVQPTFLELVLVFHQLDIPLTRAQSPQISHHRAACWAR